METEIKLIRYGYSYGEIKKALESAVNTMFSIKLNKEIQR